jgi:hypothetical protein
MAGLALAGLWPGMARADGGEGMVIFSALRGVVLAGGARSPARRSGALGTGA